MESEYTNCNFIDVAKFSQKESITSTERISNDPEAGLTADCFIFENSDKHG